MYRPNYFVISPVTPCSRLYTNSWCTCCRTLILRFLMTSIPNTESSPRASTMPTPTSRPSGESLSTSYVSSPAKENQPPESSEHQVSSDPTDPNVSTPRWLGGCSQSQLYRLISLYGSHTVESVRSAVEVLVKWLLREHLLLGYSCFETESVSIVRILIINLVLVFSCNVMHVNRAL